MVGIKISERAKAIRSVIYEHYKGGRYQLVGVAINSETLEEMVVYKALYNERLIWARPLIMFLDEVGIEGNKRPRFQWIQDGD